MDFFAGSGTTSHAAINYALKNNINIHQIIVQLPVKLDESNEVDKNAIEMGYETLADVTFARILKSIEKNKVDLESSQLEYGIKKYSYSLSNFKKWQNYTGRDLKKIETLFTQFESPLVENWKPENLLTEIILIEGFPLDSNVESIALFKKNKVQKISSAFCEHSLFVCLDTKIKEETIKALSLGDNDIFICLDNAITDQDKARLDDKGLIKTI
jgi:adenine-specific DNA-methyltransferase